MHGSLGLPESILIYRAVLAQQQTRARRQTTPHRTTSDVNAASLFGAFHYCGTVRRVSGVKVP